MPLPAYFEIPDIEGSSKIEGREGWIEVLGFNHKVYMPTDRKDGSATGTRVHEDCEILKNFDKSSPVFYEYLCNGKIIPEATLHWYQINEDGQEVEYYSHKFVNARVTAVSPHMPNVDDPANEHYKHLERVGIRYEKVTWTFLDGNVEFTDSWFEGR